MVKPGSRLPASSPTANRAQRTCLEIGSSQCGAS